MSGHCAVGSAERQEGRFPWPDFHFGQREFLARAAGRGKPLDNHSREFVPPGRRLRNYKLALRVRLRSEVGRQRAQIVVAVLQEHDASWRGLPAGQIGAFHTTPWLHLKIRIGGKRDRR